MSMPATLRGVPLTGLRLGAPLGSGSGGVAWAATLDGGQQVAVRVLPDVDSRAHTVRERRLEALRAIEHPGLARVRTMPGHVDDRLVVTDLVPGPTLGTVRTSRMGLPASESLALARDLASGLAALHGHGLVHGDVAPSNVVLTDRGDDGGAHPVLVDLLADLAGEAGTAGYVAPEVRAGRAATPAADVWSLATLCVWCTRVGDRGQVARVLGTATAEDPHARPPAEELAARLGRMATTPVHVPPPSVLAGAALRAQAQQTPTVLRPTRRRRARHRRVTPVRRAAVAVLVAAAVAVPIWALWPDAPGETSAEGRSAVVGSPTSLVDVVTDLVHARDDALVAGDAEGLAAVTAPGSPARTDDLALLESLQDTKLAGLRTEVSDARVVLAEQHAAQVQAVLSQGAHERTSAGGTTEVAAQEPRCVVLELLLDGAGWTVEQVSPCEQ